jgi:hypothetical protein
MAKPSAPSRTRMFLDAIAHSLAGPLLTLTLWMVALLLLALGVMKLAGGHPQEAPSASLLALASGGIVTSASGLIASGAVQVLLGLGLLVTPARVVAALACLLFAAGVVIGGFVHRDMLMDGSLPSAAALALALLTVVLLAGAALGLRAAARRSGANA